MSSAMTSASKLPLKHSTASARSARRQGRVTAVPNLASVGSSSSLKCKYIAPYHTNVTTSAPSRNVTCAAVGVKSDAKSKGAVTPTPVEKRNCRIYSTEGTNSNLELILSFIGENGYEVGSPIDLSTFVCVPWKEEGDSEPTGVVYEGEAVVPDGAKQELIMLRVKTGAKTDKEYINKIEVTGRNFKCNVAANSWVHKSQGARLFFADGLAYLPSQTPKDLAEWREAALKEIRGSRIDSATRREDWDRIYDYDVYDDLAGLNAEGVMDDRPTLGGAANPYPRRLRTGRSKIEGAPLDPNNPTGPKRVYETRDTDSGSFWTPLDERFNTIKSVNNKAYALLAIIPTAAEALKRKYFDADKQVTSFKELDTMYAKLEDPKLSLSPNEVVDAMKSPAGKMKSSVMKVFGINPDDIKLQLPLLSAISSSVSSIKDMVGGVQNMLDFPPPLVVKGRAGVWATDEEFGRQALAGANPSTIAAVTSRDQLGDLMKDEVLQQFTEGNSVAAMIAASKEDPRLLIQDYTAVFDAYASKISQLKDRYGYFGKAVLYRRNDGQLVPIAIQLHGSGGEKDLYTPNDHPNLWLLAKGVFNSLDSGFHQLVTHWLRTHACTEPYIIATHRQLSVLHPVYKLMMPHWSATIQINCNARKSLINSGGGVERHFTPGKWGLEMSSAVYGALWQFDLQGLPQDLASRKVATIDKQTGEFKMLLKDYPYGDDGMLLWNSVEKWVGKYLALYYDDNVAGKKVTDDPELQGWWNEIKEKGHADKKVGWPELKNIKDLTQILSTMIWIVSGHHSAINYSQYAFAGYSPNKPMVCRKKIPARGSKEYKDMIKSREAGERVYLETLNHPDGNVRSILMVEVLSAHADNDVYMGDPNHSFIMCPKALALYKEHAAEVRQIDAIVEQRNKDPARKMRSLPYEFLAPSSKPGITNRGVPQSICI